MKTKRRVRRPLNKSYIPNIITLMNMFLGFTAIIMLLKGDPIRAAWIILFAMGFDAIDGKTARMLGISNRFGTEFDSLADTVSFCVVPSLMVYTLYVKGLPPLVGALISFVPLMFGSIRLARFNLLHGSPKKFYTGLTTPLSTVMIVSFVMFNHQVSGNYGDPRIAIALVFAVSYLMISPVRFAQFPTFSLRHGRANNLRLVGVVVLTVSIILWQGLVIFPLFTVYISWSILNWLMDHKRFEDKLEIDPSDDSTILPIE
ncbi:MAG: CDP-diacylglycerol--serine O-phosphatidyltransferase [Candidatus Neomarinimicrobiota bacterium]